MRDHAQELLCFHGLTGEWEFPELVLIFGQLLLTGFWVSVALDVAIVNKTFKTTFCLHLGPAVAVIVTFKVFTSPGDEQPHPHRNMDRFQTTNIARIAREKKAVPLCLLRSFHTLLTQTGEGGISKDEGR
ncbi:MAG TPA: hypothetical protein VE783_07865 [Candidatus Limnocylindrales bacterium]|nr:hypothetical protein [Candidatus Limnocylindrales bacterium]